MASASNDSRRAALSPKPKGRENAKDTLCRNVTIYGHCRYEDKGCAFNHDTGKGKAGTMGSSGKKFNVDSPSFTPNTQHATLAIADPNRASGLSPKAANAAPFKPKGLGSGIDFSSSNSMRKTYNPTAPDWTMGINGDHQEFLPHAHALQAGMADPSAMQGMLSGYATPNGLVGQSPSQQHLHMNPYSHDISASGSMYNGGQAYVPPVQFHLMKSSQPAPKNLASNQRVASQFFTSESLREELHRKMEATQQRLDNSGLPWEIDHFHTLVPLDKGNVRNTAIFGYATWVFKVFSRHDGKPYALRRIEGYKLTNDKAIVSYKQWKKISNPNIVQSYEVFTTRMFQNDASSLMFQVGFYPNAKTLSETHQLGSRVQTRAPSQHVPEPKLWQYMVQITNALRSIHGAGLAARIIDPTKVLVTGPDQIRLNACGIKDVLDYGVDKPLAELQREDFKQFGRLIVALGTNKASVQASLSNALDHFNKVYSPALKERVYWLLNQPLDKGEGIEHFMSKLASESFKVISTAQERENSMEAELQLCINNDFSFRTLMKLSTVIDHPSRSIQYPNNGDRDPLKLLRDYIFHPLDETHKPVVDLARIIDCLQKLDAGVDEKIQLTSRDSQIIIVVTFKEMKQMLRSQYEDIMKQRTPARIT